jgi:glucan phosphoethanolaminetransferase (alkaline phosphatase superfamily)
MKNKDLIFRLLSLACLTIIPVYPNVAYALVNLSGLSYMLTGLIFALPIIALISLFRQKWVYCILTSILTILALTDLTMVDLYKDYLLPGGIISTIKTNPQEASEFYNTNLREVFHWIPLLLIYLASCILYKPSQNRKVSA